MLEQIMAITYTWEVTSLKTTNEGDNLNAVVQTYWRKIGTDEHGHTAAFDGATPFTSIPVTLDESVSEEFNSFIPFNELTEDIVLEWIKAVVIGDYELHVNAKIQEKINREHVTQPGLPWAPEKGLPPSPTEITSD
jgi:hypothetical protein